MMWFRYGHYDNRPGDLFDPNHLMAMKECYHVDSPSNSRNISFAGSSTVAESRKRKLSDELIPSGSTYLH